MADATCNAKRSNEGADTLSRLNAIFNAFWGKMASRERQAEMEAFSHTETIAQPTYRRAAIPPKGAQRRHHRRRPFLPKMKSRRPHRTSRQDPLQLNTSPTAARKPVGDHHSSLHQTRMPVKGPQQTSLDASSSIAPHTGPRSNRRKGSILGLSQLDSVSTRRDIG
ncbi:Hypothetical predicted protein [Pelobates cultripes]|uniref:Uncharacterized protein n=1 Tax=Pelobates cultripes TaxID=61616 RepID=A0AAD1RY80_PELCU|nr:Hypothetical predicted protein [Pelobates cultripes]